MDNNIVMFPKWKEQLEKESLEALKNKRYEEALKKLEKLICYRVDHQEIMVGKMICLMELERYDEAESFALLLLEKNDEGYFHYMHIYLTILFQTNQYKRLMDTIDYELIDKTIPPVMKEQFQQLYAISQNMQRDLVDSRSHEDFIEFERALTEHDDYRQWAIITRLHSIGAKPRESMYRLLQDRSVNPVVKTAFLLWIKEENITRKLHIYKFDKKTKILSDDLPCLDENNAKREVLFRLRHIENDDPTLYRMIETVLSQYLYVRYPFSFNQNDSPFIANALHTIALSNLKALEKIPENKKVQKYIAEIQFCQAMYLSVTDG